jgi:hypothetical protein
MTRGRHVPVRNAPLLNGLEGYRLPYDFIIDYVPGLWYKDSYCEKKSENPGAATRRGHEQRYAV